MTDLPVLDAVEQRVLGCLLEKQVTVPATYPLTLNALRTACNQTSSREPVMDLDEHTVETTARALRDRGLLRIVWADTGRRVLKYHQTLTEVLGLADDERALVTVLLLRGPQAPGELKVRTERLHGFGDRDAVEACLQRLAGRAEPLVRQLDRRPREQDHRWVHLLGPVADSGPEAAPGGSAAAAAPAVDRDRPIADGPDARDARVRSSYAAVAATYAARLTTELDDLPFERWLLDRTAAAAGHRPVVDAGCGPGHVTAHLAAAGADARGLDLTPAMVDQARERFPGLRFDVEDLTRLIRPETADGWGAVLGWYSLIHLAGSELPGAVGALARPLAPGGVLLLGLHAGHEVRHLTSWFDEDVELDLVLHEPADVVAAVTAAGLTDVEWYLRGPLEGRGETTQRLYVMARRAG
ncbi:DUF480 domain-containing protein [Kineosporia sp. R_H_3]|uniref:DUF480 domain-containing protein n=1 Tax=Kineosporia sp. R_H_3 TaxID=1961848 RepID=UPI000B4C0645|nr:DUF480 domain-containing protein [Kineosporia sp. R_H_3]